MSAVQLDESCHYFPFASGRYEVKVGLRNLGTDFGNAESDSRVFQFDKQWLEYRRQKMHSRRESLEKYVCEEGLTNAARRAIFEFFLRCLSQEYPDCFRVERSRGNGLVLYCQLSGERLFFNHDLGFIRAEIAEGKGGKPNPPYSSGFDALASQIQEDVAITELDVNGEDALTGLHVCFPNHWNPQDKIGHSFIEVHAPVPGFDKISRQSKSLMSTLARRGPFVRFAWGLATDRRLNHHHPIPPLHGKDIDAWTGRRFNPQYPELHLRVERQVLMGLAGAKAFLFTIRTYFEDVKLLSRERLNQLAAAVESMPWEVLVYKGIADQQQEILAWLYHRIKVAT